MSSLRPRLVAVATVLVLISAFVVGCTEPKQGTRGPATSPANARIDHDR
jgi:hypothetical protein